MRSDAGFLASDLVQQQVLLMKCPGQDTQHWQPADIFETSCPQCGRSIEFFKDDASRRCKGCGARVANPKLDFGCAESCAYAEQCLAGLPGDALKQHREHEKENGTDIKQDDPNRTRRQNHDG